VGKFDNGLFLWLGCEGCGVIQQYADSYASWQCTLTPDGLVFHCPPCAEKKARKKKKKPP
jgi:hypothetical protein